MVAPNTYYAIQDKDADFTAVTVTTLTASSTITGDVTGDITGDVTGDVTGNVTGGIFEPIAAVTADGAIAVPSVNTTYFITKAGVAAMTLVDPTATTHDGLRLTFVATTANAHTLDLVTGINGGAADVGTFGGAAGDGVTIIAYQGAWYQVPGSNTNVSFA